MRLRSISALLLACIFIASLATVAFSAVRVKGYYRKDGTYVQGHYRSNPDANPYNNWSYPGNTNPYTGKVAPGNPSTYLKNYYGQNPSSEFYGFNYNNQSFEDWLSRIGDNGESGIFSFDPSNNLTIEGWPSKTGDAGELTYSNDTQTIEEWLPKAGDSEESRDESESISESTDPYQADNEWLGNMRKNKEFEEWFIRYRKERGGLNQEDISRLYNLHLAMPSATIQEFIELFDKFFRHTKGVKQ